MKYVLKHPSLYWQIFLLMMAYMQTEMFENFSAAKENFLYQN